MNSISIKAPVSKIVIIVSALLSVSSIFVIINSNFTKDLLYNREDAELIVNSVWIDVIVNDFNLMQDSKDSIYAVNTLVMKGIEPGELKKRIEDKDTKIEAMKTKLKAMDPYRFNYWKELSVVETFFLNFANEYKSYYISLFDQGIKPNYFTVQLFQKAVSGFASFPKTVRNRIDVSLEKKYATVKNISLGILTLSILSIVIQLAFFLLKGRKVDNRVTDRDA